MVGYNFSSRPILAGRPIVSLCPHNCTLARLIIKYPAYQLLGKKYWKATSGITCAKRYSKHFFKQNLLIVTAEVYFYFVFSQKLTSWVFNDQPCECAVVGQSRTIGRAAKIGWEKKGSRLPDRIPDPAARIRFYLHKEFRAAGIRFLSTQRIGGGDLEENGHFQSRKCLVPCRKSFYKSFSYYKFLYERIS